jgi:hypothetical protein
MLGCCPRFAVVLGSSALSTVEPKALLRVQLGEHHEAFIRWCAQEDRDPTAVVKQLVDMALANLVEFPKGGKAASIKAPKRLRINLGDKHEPFAAWCAARDLATSAAVKNWIVDLMAQKIGLVSTTPEPSFHAVVDVRDESRERKELRFSKSELEAWELLAATRKEEPPKFMSRVLRAYLTKSPGFTPDEAALLGTHNLLLLRACNNLNQLAKHANALAARGDVVAAEAVSALPDEVAAVRSHVAHVSQLLSNNRERWLIAVNK